VNQKIAFTALSLVLVLGGASGAMAAGKKHSVAHEAFAAGAGEKVGNHESACDVDPQCNGWNAWLQDVKAGKLSAGH
jgi:hypothetical protein